MNQKHFLPRSILFFCVALLCLAAPRSLIAQDADAEGEFVFRFQEAMALLANGEDGPKEAAQSLKGLAVDGHARSQYWLGQFYLQGVGVAENLEQGRRWIERSAESGYPIASVALAELMLGGEAESDYERIRGLLEYALSPEAAQGVAPEEFGSFRQAKARAGYLLGMLYQNAWGVEEDRPKAIGYFLDASRLGDKDASMALAIAYAKGEDVERDIEESKRYFEMFDLQSSDALNRSIEATYGNFGDASENQNLIEASQYVGEVVSNMVYALQTEYAREVLDETSEDFDAEFAATLLKLASEGGYAEAKVWLGILYYRGMGVEVDKALAGQLFGEAAAEDWVLAQYNLATMMKAGEFEPSASSTADQLLRNAADAGLYAAQATLDGDASIGILTPPEARDLCLNNAEKGDARAMYSLAVRKTVGWLVEVEPDFSKVVELYRESSDKGYARSEYVIGVMSITGEGMPLNPMAGISLIRSAAYKGLPEAVYRLGETYVSGFGVEPNPYEALRHFERAASLGYENAKNRLAAFHFYGIVVPKNEYKAAELYLEAADEGDAEAAGNLALCYLRGVGVPMSTSEGIRWLMKSADLGSLGACYQLANIYRENLLVDQDAVEVAFWLERAAEMGDKAAMKETAFNYFLGRGQPKNKGKASNWVEAYQSHPGEVKNTDLYYPGEYETAEVVRSLLPEDYSILLLSADLKAEPNWSGSRPKDAISAYERLASKGSMGAKLRLARLYLVEGASNRNAKKAQSSLKSLFDSNRSESFEGKRRYASESAYSLGLAYMEGIGTRQNQGQGMKWLEEAAQLQHRGAQFELGTRLVRNASSPSERAKGVGWLIQAAKSGDERSQLELARQYLDSPLTQVDKDTLVDWLKSLVDEGSSDARTLLRRFGIRYKELERRESEKETEDPDFDPWAPVSTA